MGGHIVSSIDINPEPDHRKVPDSSPISPFTDAASRRSVEHLSTAECWALMEAGSIGRLAVTGLDGVPDIFPVNYTVHDGSLYMKSAPGSKLADITVHPVAAFEIDGIDKGFHWSVVLRGDARRVAIDKEIRESGVQSLVSANPSAKYNYLRVSPSSISGRRFAERTETSTASPQQAIVKPPVDSQEPTRSYEETVQRTHSNFPVAQPPVPIAHFPPL